MIGRMPKHETGEIDDAVLTVTEKEAAMIEWPFRRDFATRYAMFAFLILFVLFVRTAYLSVYRGDDYREMARQNSVRQIPVPAPRGIIYDRFGEPLVSNVPSIGAVLVPFDAPKDETGRTALKERVISVLHADPATVESAFLFADENPLFPVPIKDKLTQEEMIEFYSRHGEFVGISLFKTVHREYPDGLIFSHILGYEGQISEEEFDVAETGEYLRTDLIGKQGIEKSQERYLRGGRGYERVEVDARGRTKKTLGSVAPKPGNDLFLNVDAGLQKKIFDSLKAQIEKEGLSAGAAVALDPRDGGVLALVSVPAFDNNLFSEGIGGDEYRDLVSDPTKPMFNRAVAGTYAPGSTFKPVIAAAAISENVIGEHTEIESKGGISVGSYFFGDWKAHGFTDIRQALAVSSDVFFYTVGGGYGGISGLGISRMKEYASRFGYGARSGIDLPGEASGFLPDPDWKEEVVGEPWYVGDDYHAAIGQGFVTATPIQIANSIAVVANGGTLYAPRIVSGIRDAEGRTSSVPVVAIRRNVVTDDVLRIVREGMRKTVTEGTAQSLSTLSLPVAGKTGTAQYGSEGKTHGWFVSFAPYDDPKIVLLVLVEGQGSETYTTVPVTQSVYDWYFRERFGAD